MRPARATRPVVDVPRRVVRCLALATLCLGLAGCGLSLVYPRLDTVVGLYIEGLVSLDERQSGELERTLERNLEWHRSSELERYAVFLREFAATVGDGAGREEWLAALGRAEAWWRNIFEQAAPGYAALAATLSDAQVDELLANLEREDEEARREHASRTPRQVVERREKALRRAIERFTGPLTPAQRGLIREHAVRSGSLMEQWLENRRVWRAALADALRQRSDGAAFEARMQVLVARPDELWTPAYRASVEARRASLVDLLVALDATLAPAQRAATRRELQALADDVQDLAGRSG